MKEHTVTIGAEDGYPVMRMDCPFDMDDPERPCWSMDEVGHRDEFSTSCNWKDWWENCDDWPVEDFTISCGVEVADWTDIPRFALREAARYEPSGWCFGRSLSLLTTDPKPHYADDECIEYGCVPLYRQVTEGGQ